MLYAEFRRHLGKAGMTINNFAAYLGVRPASVSNYSKTGAVPRTYAIIAILLGEAADRGVNAEELLVSFGVVPLVVPAGSNVKQLDMFRLSRPKLSEGWRHAPQEVGTDTSGSPSDSAANAGVRL